VGRYATCGIRARVGLDWRLQANGLNPYHYLLKVFTDLPNAQTLGDVEALLPWGVTLPAE